LTHSKPSADMSLMAEAASQSSTNPLPFVTGILKAEPEPWQIEALNAFASHDRVSIRAGHGVGKTTLIAWIVLWIASTWRRFKIPITANSQDQLRDVVWPEIRKWAQKLPEDLRNGIEIGADRIIRKTADQSSAVARTASKDNPEALQGFHDEGLVFIIEEASGIPDIVFEVGLGSLSTAGAKMLMLGNPTRLSGFFYDSHNRLRDRWQTLRVSSEDVPRARGHIEDIIARYGKDSNAYRVRVLGEFPRAEDDTVISLEMCERAIARRGAVARIETIAPVWGLDVARFGDDRTALAKRQANELIQPVVSWHGMDTMQTAGRVFAEWRDTVPEMRPASILVDVIGIGAGVVDRLRELGVPVRGINVGEAASANERYMRLRDELWFRGREWLTAGTAIIPKDDALIAELVEAHYEILSTGKIVVESKADMKERGVRSPDLADAFLLTFAGGDHRIPAPKKRDPYRDGRRSGEYRSWMTA